MSHLPIDPPAMYGCGGDPLDDDRFEKQSANHKAFRRAVKEIQAAGYCYDYHCAGDCGMPHSSAEMKTMVQGLMIEHGITGTP